MFRMKIYKVRGEILVAVCDSELVGKKFEDGDIKIEISEKFYGTENFEENEVKKALKQATIANISGKRAIKIAIDLGLVDEDKILKIGKCWHAQIVTL